VDAERPALGGDVDQRLELLGHGVGHGLELVDDQHQPRERVGAAAAPDRRPVAEDVGLAGGIQDRLPPLQLGPQRDQRALHRGGVEVGDHADGVGQVDAAPERGAPLVVDEHEDHLVGAVVGGEGGDDGLEQLALARPGRPTHQHVGPLGEVEEEGPVGTLADRNRRGPAGAPERLDPGGRRRIDAQQLEQAHRGRDAAAGSDRAGVAQRGQTSGQGLARLRAQLVRPDAGDVGLAGAAQGDRRVTSCAQVADGAAALGELRCSIVDAEEVDAVGGAPVDQRTEVVALAEAVGAVQHHQVEQARHRWAPIPPLGTQPSEQVAQLADPRGDGGRVIAHPDLGALRNLRTAVGQPADPLPVGTGRLPGEDGDGQVAGAVGGRRRGHDRPGQLPGQGPRTGDAEGAPGAERERDRRVVEDGRGTVRARRGSGHLDRRGHRPGPDPDGEEVVVLAAALPDPARRHERAEQGGARIRVHVAQAPQLVVEKPVQLRAGGAEVQPVFFHVASVAAPAPAPVGDQGPDPHQRGERGDGEEGDLMRDEGHRPGREDRRQHGEELHRCPVGRAGIAREGDPPEPHGRAQPGRPVEVEGATAGGRERGVGGGRDHRGEPRPAGGDHRSGLERAAPCGSRAVHGRTAARPAVLEGELGALPDGQAEVGLREALIHQPDRGLTADLGGSGEEGRPRAGVGASDHQQAELAGSGLGGGVGAAPGRRRSRPEGWSRSHPSAHPGSRQPGGATAASTG
jgi:hypothetical protein